MSKTGKDKPVLYTYGDYRIERFDTYNYTVNKFTFKKKIKDNINEDETKKTWKLVGYTATFEAACKLLRNNLINDKVDYAEIRLIVDMFGADIDKHKHLVIDKLGHALEKMQGIYDKLLKKTHKDGKVVENV